MISPHTHCQFAKGFSLTFSYALAPQDWVPVLNKVFRAFYQIDLNQFCHSTKGAMWVSMQSAPQTNHVSVAFPAPSKHAASAPEIHLQGQVTLCFPRSC